MDIKQRDDGSVSFFSDVEGFDCGRAGGPKTPTNGTGAKYRMKTIAAVPMASGTTATNSTGAVATWGPFNEDRVITNVGVYISSTTPACSLDLGVASAAGVFSNNLINGLTTTGLGTFDSATNKGTSGKSIQYMTAGQVVTCTPSASYNTLAGNIYLEYFPA